jgi:hypothetical protein
MQARGLPNDILGMSPFFLGFKKQFLEMLNGRGSFLGL